ncbi:MAG: helix-turn-helix transcriptional regulator [Lachnospiraceae bacterium]|nr:helix-turn-helix transcriptional regulator [Lachnospiraceae bacterium]
MDCVIYDFKSVLPEATGKNIKSKIKKAGYSVNYIQNYLRLSCPQPIYRWFNGKVMPSLNHLYMLSRLLNIHMEQLLVSGYMDRCDVDDYECLSIVSRTIIFSDYINGN